MGDSAVKHLFYVLLIALLLWEVVLLHRRVDALESRGRLAAPNKVIAEWRKYTEAWK
jgi:hypothetical protein